MNLSGIVVAVTPERFEAGISALQAFDNLEVHQTDAATGQIVVVQEAANINQEIDGLKKIKSLPMVTYAEMVYHYLADDDEINVVPDESLDFANLDETLKKLNS